MTKRQAILLLIVFNIIFYCFGQQDTEQIKDSKEHYSFNTDSLLYHVQTLSSDVFEGRKTGSKGAQITRDYILKRFNNFNILPLVESYLQPFSFHLQGKTYEGINLLGYIKGSENSENYIVISAHYDHEGIKNNTIYNGADDNASGVSALLAFAEYFSKNTPNHSIILAAFDAEELGLEGAKYFVNNPTIKLEQIRLNINIDMISRNDKNQLYAVGSRYNDNLNSIITSYITSKKIVLKTGHDGTDGHQDWTYSGDHGPFHLKNIPFIYFGVEDHSDYHKPTDDFENIHPEFFKTSVETIIDIFKLIDAYKL